MEQVYLGRIVAVAVTPSGRPAALYRVSSRSFPNRMAEVAPGSGKVSIVPKPGFETDVAKNPYIAYNAARLVGQYAILANGSHTDPIAEKIAMGMPVRDALALSLLAMDYEKDDYSTPRIAAVADASRQLGWLATIRRDGLDVRCVDLDVGQVMHLSTYVHDIPGLELLSEFTAETAADACQFLVNGGVFADFTNPVTAVAAVAEGDGFALAALDVQ
ncbi:MAG: IMP cyclohydrolase [Planctomycetes bacterium]|nr:IMP cyclohydrolase [Planctomycetota bacterium]